MSMEQSRVPINKQVIDEAAEWFVELNEGDADETMRRQFDAWLRSSPQHVQAYLKMLPIWEDGASLDGQAYGDPQALIDWARGGRNIVPISASAAFATAEAPATRASRGLGRRPVARVHIAAAVALFCIAMALGAWLLIERHSLYETGIGELRLVTLADGSKMELNSRSSLKVRFTEHGRNIDLLTGQALFHVAKDRSRPFVVRSGDTYVRAVGTQFDVYRKISGTVVTVVEGRVAVSSSGANTRVQPPSGVTTPAESASIPLSAGEQAIFARSVEPWPAALRGSAAALRPRPHRADVTAATAWTQQRLVFSRTSLREVVEEFNRYNERQILIKDGALRMFNVSGVFSSTDPASLVRFLRTQPGMQVSETESEISISQIR